MKDKEKLAKQFAAALLEEIGIDNLCEVNRLNFREIDFESVCHSHDFCDANEIMLLTVDPNMNEWNDIEDQWNDISEIWGIAKRHRFYIVC